MGIGGFGATGGNAGEVVNTVTGTLLTKSDDSYGVIAQSAGGEAVTEGSMLPEVLWHLLGKDGANAGNLGVGIGGFGGGAGDGMKVTNTVRGMVRTEGHDSTAILGQSLGGGGGNGGMNVTGSITASLKGNAGALGVGIGGFGGGGGKAGEVISDVEADFANEWIATKGDRSMGVVAQSLGGGGGNGGMNITGQLSYSDEKGGNVSFGLGGFGGTGGDSGVVNSTVKANILTEGSESHGVVAQSLAGGGGNGGLNVSGGLSYSSQQSSSVASIGIGGFGGGGGNAESVTLAFEGQINNPWSNGQPDSTATGSHGILAQSLGGGGGNGAINVSAGVSYSSKDEGNALVVGIGGFGGLGGNAKEVNVTVTGDQSITAHGDNASAIFLLSHSVVVVVMVG